MSKSNCTVIALNVGAIWSIEKIDAIRRTFALEGISKEVLFRSIQCTQILRVEILYLFFRETLLLQNLSIQVYLLNIFKI